jgi:hypothetical protein
VANCGKVFQGAEDMIYLIQFVLAVLAGMLVAAVFGGGK